MVSYIWFFLIIIGIVYSFLTGNVANINESILTNGAEALELMLSIFPVIVLWSGIMKIAEDAGLLVKFARFLEPILSKLFPSVPKDNPALGYIASNIAANMMGLGSAATPFGLRAMSELQKINDKKDTASVPMITFLVLNTAGVTIVALLIKYTDVNELILSLIVTALISSLTIGGKALGKNYAMNKSTQIITRVSKILSVFSKN